MQFRVSFRPKADNVYYAAQLELFAVTRRALQSSIAAAAPTADTTKGLPPPRPWALVVNAAGHTFAPQRQESLPMVSLSTDALEFPAGYQGAQSVQVLAAMNEGSTPVSFHASATAGDADDDVRPPFAVYPESGVVPPGSRLLLAVRFLATAAKTISGKLRLVVNGGAAQVRLQPCCRESGGRGRVIPRVVHLSLPPLRFFPLHAQPSHRLSPSLFHRLIMVVRYCYYAFLPGAPLDVS